MVTFSFKPKVEYNISLKTLQDLVHKKKQVLFIFKAYLNRVFFQLKYLSFKNDKMWINYMLNVWHDSYLSCRFRFVSLSDVQPKSHSTPIKLSSESTSEFLLAPVGQDNIDYYEIYPSCNLRVTNVGEIITYVIVVSLCEEETKLWA